MLGEDVVGDDMRFVKPNEQVKIRFFDGKPVNMELPTAVTLKVVKTDPGVKGNTVNNHFKPAELETGLTIKVPLYIEQEEDVRVDTRSGEFMERAKV
jgi:elongation factor P